MLCQEQRASIDYSQTGIDLIDVEILLNYSELASKLISILSFVGGNKEQASVVCATYL